MMTPQKRDAELLSDVVAQCVNGTYPRPSHDIGPDNVSVLRLRVAKLLRNDGRDINRADLADLLTAAFWAGCLAERNATTATREG